MIRIPTQGPSDPEYDKWRERAVRQREHVLAHWEKCRDSPTTPKVWREAKPQEIWGDLKRIFLHKIFYYKCAYCEGRYDAGHPWQVEHYRPKAEVTEFRKLINHPGYFWLAYEWYNLLLCCAHCNTWEEKSRKTLGKSHPSKSNEFRVLGRRVTEPGPDPSRWQGELEAERPLLLHPYFDDPEEHLSFDNLGFIYGTTERGRETVRVCNLYRLVLAEAHREAKARVFKSILDQLQRAEQRDAPLDRYFGPKHSFSAWKNFWAMVLIGRITPRHERPAELPPVPVPAPEPTSPDEWPADKMSQYWAALAAIAQHPEGLTPEQLLQCYRRARNVVLPDLQKLLESSKKVRTDGAGRYFLAGGSVTG
jgi:hypothetical protein